MSPPAPGYTSDDGREPWVSLPEDLIRLVASRVLDGDLLDYVRFRAACGSWRSATTCPRGRGVADPRFHPRRWMLFPEGHGLYPGHPDLGGRVRFVNLDTGALARARLPLFADHHAIDSVDGLLVLIRDEDTSVRLLHPFTGDVAELPPLATLLPHLAAHWTGPALSLSVEKLTRTVCASVSCSAGAVTVMLALNYAERVAFASTLDQQQQWNLSSWRYGSCSDPPFSFRGKLYVAHPVLFSEDIQIFQIDPPEKDGVYSVCALQPPKLIATLPGGNLVSPVLMVECDSEILVLGYKDYSTRLQYVIFKLADLARQRCIQITSIGGNALFASERSLSVSSKALGTAMADSVVTTDSNAMTNHLVQYHLSSDTWSPAADDCNVYGPAPGPCSFSHHIFSCCDRIRWSEGRVFGMHPQGWYGERQGWFGGR